MTTKRLINCNNGAGADKLYTQKIAGQFGIENMLVYSIYVISVHV